VEQSNTNFQWSKKTILAAVAFFALLASIPLGAYLVQQSQSLNSKAVGPKNQQDQLGLTIDNVKSYLNIPAFKQDLQNEKMVATPTVMISQTPQVANKINQTANQVSSVTPTPTPIQSGPTPTTVNQQTATTVVFDCAQITCDINSDDRFDANDGLFIKSCEGKTAPFGSCQKVDVASCEGAITAADIQIFTSQCPQIF